MAENAAMFNHQEIGKLIIKLQQACSGCSKKGTAAHCDAVSSCPVGISRKIMGQYLNDEHQVIKDFDLNKLPSMPAGAEFDKAKLNEIFRSMHDLCNKCMFHADKCFLNICYTMMEIALDKPDRKSFSEKPSERQL